MSMSEVETMDVYLRAVREKMSELTAVVGLELEDDVKLAIILNVSNTQELKPARRAGVRPRMQ